MTAEGPGFESRQGVRFLGLYTYVGTLVMSKLNLLFWLYISKTNASRRLFLGQSAVEQGSSKNMWSIKKLFSVFEKLNVHINKECNIEI
jgi:hypothetical protein